MVSARPQFEAACQLHELAGLAQWECRELVPLRRVFDSLDQLQFLWRGLARGLRAGILGPFREVEFLSSPPKARLFKGITPPPPHGETRSNTAPPPPPLVAESRPR